MATSMTCLAQLSRICLSSSRQTIYRPPAAFLAPIIQVRHKGFAGKIISKKEKPPTGPKTQVMKFKKKNADKKKKKPRTTYRQYDVKDIEQFSLLDAMRYVN